MTATIDNDELRSLVSGWVAYVIELWGRRSKGVEPNADPESKYLWAFQVVMALSDEHPDMAWKAILAILHEDSQWRVLSPGTMMWAILFEPMQ